MRPEDEAIAIASNFGLVVSDPITLSDSNNVVVWLRPSPVVAKVASGHHHRLALELSVAKHLAASGAPVVPPATELPQEVHSGGQLEVTFWAYQPHDDKEPDCQELARALLQLHSGLLSYEGRLPSYQNELVEVADVLSDASRAPALAARDRSLLLTALGSLQAELARCVVHERPLHGCPHSSNTLVTERGVHFIDFETACLGPLEWDLAHVTGGAVDAYSDSFDPSVLELCRALVSVKTAAWCWAKFEHPTLRWHARHHLAVVRQLMAE